MGFEYQLDFGQVDGAQADRILRGVDGFEKFTSEFGTYSNRKNSTGDMPDLEARVEATGIYLCDYGCGADTLEAIRRAFARAGFAGIPHQL